MNKVIKNISLIITGLMILAFAGCMPDDDFETPLTYQEQLAVDIDIIDQYLADNSIDAEEDKSGLRYVITEQGTGANPDLTDDVTINYEGRLLSNNNLFDEGENVEFPLDRLIDGWQIGLPKIKEGGSIILYIPSGLGYGTSGAGGSIPANANLIFEIDLISVN